MYHGESHIKRGEASQKHKILLGNTDGVCRLRRWLLNAQLRLELKDGTKRNRDQRLAESKIAVPHNWLA